MCRLMLSSCGCHTVKSILYENPRKVVWLFSLSYMKLRRRGQRRRTTRTADDKNDDVGRRRWMAMTADDKDSGVYPYLQMAQLSHGQFVGKKVQQ